MDYETITCSVADGIATLEMNRPGVMNAMNGRMRSELQYAFEAIGDDVRVIVLTGSGQVFCSGQDLGDAAKVSDIEIETLLREEYHPLVRAMLDCRVPIVAAVNGAAAGAGANLALAADIVIARESAFFMQAFVRIGLIPDAGGTYWLPRRVGSARAMGMAMLGDRITARQAADWGMVWKCVSDATFDVEVREVAFRLSKGPTEAYRLARRAIRLGLEQTFEQQLETEATLQGIASRTRDFREGVMAFLEKRPADFEGR
ncbi:MAG: enoyl-CoA hydratase-related protein [Paracoccaceae bacterium]|nr:enoyl-CoA hydratase-related protein [Paracoccaceae bacterium]MDE2914385.1 enoyl-CoA hydratase-related protein [Paracoccaceae bacterium]